MSKKTVGIVGTIVLSFFVLWWFGARSQAALPTAEQAKTQSALSSPETFFDFGTITMSKGKVSRTFAVTNGSANDVTIDSITTSCMCTSAYIVNGESKKGPFGMPGHGAVPKANEIVKAGETKNIEIVYDPNAHGPAGVGPVDRVVYIKDAQGGVLQFRIKAVVTP